MVNHLRRQKQKSVNQLGRCRYRTKNRKGVILKCAVGCLIPDKLYSSRIENKTVLSMTVKKVMTDICDDYDLLRAFQDIHDNSSIIWWEKNFKIQAEHRGLKLPKTKKIEI